MTINPTEYKTNEYEEAPPLTPIEGKVEFLGPETVKYISPPRREVPRQRVRTAPPVPPPPPQYPQIPQVSHQQNVISPPPAYQSPMYPPVLPAAPPPSMVPMQMPMMAPQMAPQYMHQPMMAYMPQQPVMQMAPMAPMAHPVQLASPPLVQQQPQQQVSPSITLCINQSPQSLQTDGNPGGGVGALVCPKCRKGIITRKQDRFRKKILMFLAICCCPFTCGLPLCCLCCNYVDTCGSCKKNYGHRGRKSYKKKVNAVKL